MDSERKLGLIAFGFPGFLLHANLSVAGSLAQSTIITFHTLHGIALLLTVTNDPHNNKENNGRKPCLRLKD